MPEPFSPLTRFFHVDWLFSANRLLFWRAGFVCLFCALTAHLTVVTCLGLYYLMGRLYRRDTKVITKKPQKEAA